MNRQECARFDRNQALWVVAGYRALRLALAMCPEWTLIRWRARADESGHWEVGVTLQSFQLT